MSKDQLAEMEGEINPKRTFTVHTENQQQFQNYCSNVQRIEEGKRLLQKFGATCKTLIT
jgi:hypothetical protein